MSYDTNVIPRHKCHSDYAKFAHLDASAATANQIVQTRVCLGMMHLEEFATLMRTLPPAVYDVGSLPIYVEWHRLALCRCYVVDVSTDGAWWRVRDNSVNGRVTYHRTP